MQVDSYIFKSPYPSQVQVGQDNPVQSNSDTQEQFEVPETSQNIDNRAVFSSNTSSSEGVNVANSFTNNTLQNSLDNFASLNTQLKAAEAYAN